jgi:hypothetical protein
LLRKTRTTLAPLEQDARSTLRVAPTATDTPTGPPAQLSALLYLLARCASGEHATLGMALHHLDLLASDGAMHPLLRSTAARIAAQWRGQATTCGHPDDLGDKPHH